MPANRNEIQGFSIADFRPQLTHTVLESPFPVAVNQTDDGQFEASAFSGAYTAKSDTIQHAIFELREIILNDVKKRGQ